MSEFSTVIYGSPGRERAEFTGRVTPRRSETRASFFFYIVFPLLPLPLTLVLSGGELIRDRGVLLGPHRSVVRTTSIFYEIYN